MKTLLNERGRWCATALICEVYLELCYTRLSEPKINSSTGTVALQSDAASPIVCVLARLIIQRDQLVDITKPWRMGTFWFSPLWCGLQTLLNPLTKHPLTTWKLHFCSSVQSKLLACSSNQTAAFHSVCITELVAVVAIDQPDLIID